jgi:hypothetical protein
MRINRRRFLTAAASSALCLAAPAFLRGTALAISGGQASAALPTIDATTSRAFELAAMAGKTEFVTGALLHARFQPSVLAGRSRQHRHGSRGERRESYRCADLRALARTVVPAPMAARIIQSRRRDCDRCRRHYGAGDTVVPHPRSWRQPRVYAGLAGC